MLSAGFLTLAALKLRVLPAAMQDDTEYDEQLEQIGKGVAVRMNQYTARSLERGVDVVEELDAGAFVWVLSRYPVESISGILLKDPDDSTTPITPGSWKLSKRSGLLQTANSMGTRMQSMVITYTGGYWLNDNGTMPNGATELPADLLEAFVAQVQAVCEHREIFRTIALRKEDRTPSEAKVTELQLIAEVVETLNPYRRFS